jgi:hypothetical protein
MSLKLSLKKFVRSLVNSIPSFSTSGLYYKRFTIVIYHRNDSGLYHKTTIVANLALVRKLRS